MRALRAVILRLAAAAMYVATAAGALMAVFVVLAASMRYLAGAPFRFTEELVGLLFVTLVFGTLAQGAVRRRHIGVSLLTAAYPPALRRLADALAGLLTLAGCVVFGYFSYEFAAFSYQIHARSDASGLLLWPWMALMPAACVLLGLVTAARLAAPLLEEPERPDDDAAGAP